MSPVTDDAAADDEQTQYGGTEDAELTTDFDGDDEDAEE